MTTRIPPLSGTGPTALLQWASALVSVVQKLTSRLALDVSLGTMRAYSVADLPDPSAQSRLIYVTDEAGGAVPAFSDGVSWRRCTDRAVVS